MNIVVAYYPHIYIISMQTEYKESKRRKERGGGEAGRTGGGGGQCPDLTQIAPILNTDSLHPKPVWVAVVVNKKGGNQFLISKNRSQNVKLSSISFTFHFA